MVALGVYLITLAPDLTWAHAASDGVEFIVASSTLGIAHPPGYPVYIILGKLFTLLPLGTVAFRYNLFSAVTTAAAISLLTLAIGMVNPRVRPTTATAAALLFAFTPLVWSQAVVAEVYGLNLLMVAAFLLAWSRSGVSIWSGIWLGLAITTHLTSALLLPAFLISGRHRLGVLLVGMAIGFSPLLLLPLLAGGNSPIVWGAPYDLSGWLWLVTGRLYGANLLPGIDIAHWSGLLRAILFGPAFLLPAGGITAAVSHPIGGATTDSRPTVTQLALTSCLYTIFALIYKTPDAAVLLLPGMMIFILIVAPLLDRLGIAALLLPAMFVVMTFNSRDLSGENQVRPMAETVLRSAPQNALLLTPGDRTIFTLQYFQYVESVRPDLKIVDANLFAFDWYRARLKAQHPELAIPNGDDLISLQHNNETTIPFCLASFVSSPGTYPDGEPAGEMAGNSPYLYCKEGPH